MDVSEVRGRDLSEEQLRAFRRAADERGAEAVVEWNGHPHLVSGRRDEDGEELFTLEPIPTPFG